jgi:hypothetical protein
MKETKPISGVFEDVLGEKGSDPSFVLTAGSMAATIRTFRTTRNPTTSHFFYVQIEIDL